MKRVILTFLSVFLFVACNCDDELDQNLIDLNLIAKGVLNGSEGVESQAIKIDNQAMWDDFLTEMESQLDFFTTTSVDFDTKRVIAVVGEVQTSGSELTIFSVEETANNIVVTYSIELNATTVISQPYHVVSMPKSSKAVIFIKED